ncbi:branched chain amino acid/phenylalanine ABC transporter ATP binding subunit LivF [Candidatus Nitrotoga sp. M5]|nr:branched chain amino acid/phenylalanine ABC transporter ATP binding subunit LivF [Candidatus Nitrotoga sp. M5]
MCRMPILDARRAQIKRVGKIEMILNVTNLSLAYGSRIAVDQASMTVAASECVALVGANGAGKSTLLKSIVGIQNSFGGSISFDGRDVTKWTPEAAVRAGVILCPEGRHLFPEMSVRDNLLLGATKLNLSNAQTRAKIKEIEELFPVVNERKNQLAGTLSGGEQQMVALGRALMSQPKLLILDEPSLGLAPLLVERVFEIVLTILETGCSVLIAEQNVQSALGVAHRAYVMEAGKIVKSGDASRLSTDPALLSAFIGVDEI